MKHAVEAFFCDRLLISLEAEINTTYQIVESLTVFKVGEKEYDPIDITNGLTKDERALLCQVVLDDYLNSESPIGGDPLELSKQQKEWRMDQEGA